jgi:hypothetical protein
MQKLLTGSRIFSLKSYNFIQHIKSINQRKIYCTSFENSFKKYSNFTHSCLFINTIEGQDYSVVTNGYTYIDEGTSTGSVSVTIKGDNLPEIDEKFVMQVTSVEVISNDSSTKYPPLFGSITLESHL